MSNNERCERCHLGETACICGLIPDGAVIKDTSYNHDFAVMGEFTLSNHDYKVFVAVHVFDDTQRVLYVERDTIPQAKHTDSIENDIHEQFAWLINRYVTGVING